MLPKVTWQVRERLPVEVLLLRYEVLRGEEGRAEVEEDGQGGHLVVKLEIGIFEREKPRTETEKCRLKERTHNYESDIVRTVTSVRC